MKKEMTKPACRIELSTDELRDAIIQYINEKGEYVPELAEINVGRKSMEGISGLSYYAEIEWTDA